MSWRALARSLESKCCMTSLPFQRVYICLMKRCRLVSSLSSFQICNCDFAFAVMIRWIKNCRATHSREFELSLRDLQKERSDSRFLDACVFMRLGVNGTRFDAGGGRTLKVLIGNAKDLRKQKTIFASPTEFILKPRRVIHDGVRGLIIKFPTVAFFISSRLFLVHFIGVCVHCLWMRSIVCIASHGFASH